jgi:hypothetical protein
MYGITDDLIEWRDEALELRKEVKRLKKQLATGKVTKTQYVDKIEETIKFLQDNDYVVYHNRDLELIRCNFINKLGILQDKYGRVIGLQG